jgi:hypothetical protein
LNGPVSSAGVQPPQDSEGLVAQELALRRARREAAIRDTAGLATVIKVLSGVLFAGAIIPALGILSVLAGLFVGFFGTLALAFKGNPSGALKQVLITGVGAVVATIVWAIVTFVVFA